MLIGIGNTAEEVREPCDVARPIRLQPIERVDDITESRGFLGLACTEPQP